MKVIFKTIRKIIGIFFLIQFITCIFLFFTELKDKPLLAIIVCLFFGIIAYLLLKKSSTPVVNKTVSVKSNEMPSSYIETNAVIYRADGKKITDEETSHLQQIGRDEAQAKFLYPQYVKLIQESYQIMYDTLEPKTLCDRHAFAKEKLDTLNYYQNEGWINRQTDLLQYNTLLSDDNYHKLILHCYQKYSDKANTELKTKKGIENRINNFWKCIQDNISTELYIKIRTVR